MIFSSTAFVLGFLPLVFAAFFTLQHWHLATPAKAWLLAASLFFYAWWNPFYLPLLLGSIWFNHRCGLRLLRRDTAARRPGAVLALGVGANLALLAWFKYADFLVGNVNALTGSTWSLPEVVLPLGISFFTFTQIAWLVDCSRGDVAGAGALDYALFVTYFPHLIAGPILHHREMMSQFASRRTRVLHPRNLHRGLVLFSVGLAKKVLLADTFASWADAGFDVDAPLDFFDAWAASLSYALQLYFDFSGYCDMAMGMSLLFNVRLPLNFDSPYRARDIQDFWRRWHITLSRFLRDYLYIPLGGNRAGAPRAYANLLATFLLGGLWHGASWMFVAWGALHGVALVVHRIWRQQGRRLARPAAWLLTFLFVDVAWIFFRARDWDDARRVLAGMANLRSITEWPLQHLPTSRFAWAGALPDAAWGWLPPSLIAALPALLAIAVGFALCARPDLARTIGRGVPGRRQSVFALILFSAAFVVMNASRQTVFLYFNF